MREAKKRTNGRANTDPVSRCALHVSFAAFPLASLLSLVSVSLSAAETNTVSFDRDVRPIFEQSCFRCHGPVKPKSDFRLDSRAEALQGGDDNTNDIVPGHSDRSMLIRYVAGWDKEIHMPPEASGLPPLAPAQVATLKAWIDQGAPWGTNAGPPALVFDVSPTLRWIGVSGDEKKFRELEGLPAGFGGGVSDFYSRQRHGDSTLTLSGHALFPERDLKFSLQLEKNSVGFVDGGVETWRKYYDDTGGYYPGFTPPSYSLGRDLFVDLGRIWLDLGWTPRRGPNVVLGYEYRFRQGNEASLAWGAVPPGAGIKSIYPNVQGVSEHTHILKLDITEKWRGWEMEDHARGEFYRLDESRGDTPAFPTIGIQQQRNQKVIYTQGANTFRVERQLTDWWRVSAGSLYSRFDGTTFFQLNAADSFGALVPNTYWRADGVTLERDSRVVSLATLLLPVNGLSVSAAGQAEWTHEQGFGNVALDFGDPTPTVPGIVSANQDQTEFSEIFRAQFNRLPRTVLFAEARLQQQSVGQSDQANGGIAAADIDFLPNNSIGQHTDALNHLYDARAGFTSSPWPWLEFGGHYRRRESSTGYNNLAFEPGNGYPGFLTHRDIALDEIEGRFVLRPVVWLNARLTYDWDQTRYSSATAGATNFLDGALATFGGPLLDGRTESDRVGLNLMFTPAARFWFSGSFTYSWSRTATESAAAPAVAPYFGNTWTAGASAGWALNAKTELNASYAFSRSTYGQNNTAGLPLGLDFTRHELRVGLTRQITKRLSGSLRYQFSDYSEPSSGGVNNFTAHGVFATLAYKWP